MQTTKPTVAGSSRKRFVKGSWGAHRTLKKDKEPGLSAASLEVQQGKSPKTLAAWGRGGSYCCWSPALITQSRPEEIGAVPGTPELNTPTTLLIRRARLASYGCCLMLIISASTSARTCWLEECRLHTWAPACKCSAKLKFYFSRLVGEEGELEAVEWAISPRVPCCIAPLSPSLGRSSLKSERQRKAAWRCVQKIQRLTSRSARKRKQKKGRKNLIPTCFPRGRMRIAMLKGVNFKGSLPDTSSRSFGAPMIKKRPLKL